MSVLAVSVDADSLELGLISLFPFITLISSLLLKPDAQKAVKQLLPTVVGIVVAVVYFLVDAFPETGEQLVVNVMALIALANKFYDPVSSVFKLTTGVSLNAKTGAGLIGTAPTIEGD